MWPLWPRFARAARFRKRFHTTFPTLDVCCTQSRADAGQIGEDDSDARVGTTVKGGQEPRPRRVRCELVVGE